MFAKIKPIDVFPRGRAAALEALAIVTPSKGASVEWRLSDEKMQPLSQGMEAMPVDAYEKWGDDDAYLFEWLASHLGLKIVEFAEHSAPPVVNPSVADDPTEGCQ
jgi:hypothetical protein